MAAITGNTFQPTTPKFPMEGKSAEGDNVQLTNVEEPIRTDVASGSLTYFGFAELGSSDSASVWKIKRQTVAGNVTSISYADLDRLYDNVWNDRASLIYA